MMKINIETTVNASVEDCWTAWTSPEHITQWNFASDDWCCPRAALDLQPGGKFDYRMELKADASMGFDLVGEFTAVTLHQTIEYYLLGDNRAVVIQFSIVPTAEDDNKKASTRIVETFEAEDVHSAEQQRQGWQSILNNFKCHLEQDLS
jgi:uncharacterized protein YndB with AHSA1/START domain